jgi:transcriptional regulator with XRE-family HTH domain
MSDFGDELARLMAVRGVGVRELARQVHYNAGHISNLKNGRARPSAELTRALDQALGADGSLVAIGPIPESDDSGLIELARRAEASDLGSGTLELLQEAADRLCREYTVAEPRALASRARQNLGYVTNLLGKRVTLAQHRELLVTAGWLTAVLACASYDAADSAAASTARKMTRQFGETANHSELAAWSFEIAAWFALTEGRFADAVALCDAGMERAGTTNAGVQLSVQSARAFARMGDRRARDGLAAGQAILDHLPAGDPQHHFVFDAGKHEFYVATVLTWLGTDDHAAEEHARWVIAECQPGHSIRWPMRLAISQLDLALIKARHGELDEAVALGNAALRLGRRSAQLLPRAAELEHDLACRYPGERLTAGYRDVLRQERRALPPAAAQQLTDAIAQRALT